MVADCSAFIEFEEEGAISPAKHNLDSRPLRLS